MTMEENVHIGGFGEQVRDFLTEHGYGGQILTIAIKDQFVPHGNTDILKMELGLDAPSIAEKIIEGRK